MTPETVWVYFNAVYNYHAILCTVALTCCQAMMHGTAVDRSKLALGMTRVQAIEVLGTRTTVDAE